MMIMMVMVVVVLLLFSEKFNDTVIRRPLPTAGGARQRRADQRIRSKSEGDMASQDVRSRSKSEGARRLEDS